MRLVLLLVAFTALLYAARADDVYPVPGAVTCSDIVYANSAAAAGAHFSASVACANSSAVQCNCIPSVAADDDLQYSASYTYSRAGAACNCTFTLRRDTPANVAMFRACAVCE